MNMSVTEQQGSKYQGFSIKTRSQSCFDTKSFLISLAIDNAFDREAKYIALLYIDLFKPLQLFSTIIMMHTKSS